MSDKLISSLALASLLACGSSTEPESPGIMPPVVAPGTETQITADPSYQKDADISGDWIVWEDTRNGNLDIYMYDLATGVESQITTDTAYQQNPAISGNRIVWVDNRNGKSDIYMYDLATGVESLVTPDPADIQDAPDISDNRIVWTDNRNNNGWDIYMYDLTTGVEWQITNDPGNEWNPAISGNRIVWEGYRVREEAPSGIKLLDYPDVYVYELTVSAH